ncbi:MAG: glycosyltransferase [Bacteroidales bacterium]|nr:glycosyltransferase [Bacteroidales bacterium]
MQLKEVVQVKTNGRFRNKFYHKSLEKYFSFYIPRQSKVLEIGCGTGDLLHAVNPSYGVGIDFSSLAIEHASKKYPGLHFHVADADQVESDVVFDYIILSDILHVLTDVQKVLKHLKKNTGSHTRLVISNYNFLWEPVLKFGEWIGLKHKDPFSNWLSHHDIFNLLELEGYQVIKNERKILFPKYLPLFNFIFNKILVNLPFFNMFGLVNFIIARPVQVEEKELPVSIIIPARNEKGNIENAIKRTPAFGSAQQFIFIEGNSSDGTFEEMKRIQEIYKDKSIQVIRQTGKGKGNAVREGFEIATGEVLMILDADLTTPPEDLPKFYDAIVQNKGEFINGCRLVYPMEKEAMRFLNLIGNKFFSWFFSYILGQRLKDTLCGTKVLLKKDYEKIKQNRSYFGNFDPFGDFDLLFGAAKLNLKITEIYVRYKDREYGSTQISRFKHGWLLLKMSFFAASKIKFI